MFWFKVFPIAWAPVKRPSAKINELVLREIVREVPELHPTYVVGPYNEDVEEAVTEVLGSTYQGLFSDFAKVFSKYLSYNEEQLYFKVSLHIIRYIFTNIFKELDTFLICNAFFKY